MQAFQKVGIKFSDNDTRVPDVVVFKHRPDLHKDGQYTRVGLTRP